LKKINIDSKDIKPLDTDGIMPLNIGTVLFAVATLFIYFEDGVISEADKTIWLRIAIFGFFLGIIGLTILHNRKRKLKE